MHSLSYKNDDFNITEPFKGLFTQGMVCHETYKDNNGNWLSPEEVDTENGKVFYKKDNRSEVVKVGPSESMSKSKKNTINPENIIDAYGSDAIRLFILSDSPPEKDVQWSEQGMAASYKFLQKLWSLHQKIMKKISEEESSTAPENITNFTKILVNKITDNLEKFHYNVIIANFHETYNFLNKEIDEKINNRVLKENYVIILKLLFPIIPHFSSEALEQLKEGSSIFWPKINKKDIVINNKINLVVQINGKKRSLINIKKDIDEKNLIEIIKKDQKILKFINGDIIKVIFIKNRLINLIIK